MRFIQVLPFLASVATAQVSVVQGAFTKISNDVTALDTAVKGFSGDGTALLKSSDSLLSDIKAGTTTVQNSQDLDVTGATQIATSVTGLQSDTQQTIQDLISSKSKLVAAGYGGNVYQTLVAQKSASQALSDAVAKKTPTALQSVATQLSSGILDAIQKGIDAYSDQKNTPTAAVGGGGSAPASSAAPAKSSAPAVSSVTAPNGAVSSSYTPVMVTTTGSSPSQFTGGAAVQAPIMGFALAAAGVVAAL